MRGDLIAYPRVAIGLLARIIPIDVVHRLLR